jgi:hypothetical protein
MNSPIFARSSRALTTRRPLKLTQSTTPMTGNAMSVIKWWARIRKMDRTKPTRAEPMTNPMPLSAPSSRYASYCPGPSKCFLPRCYDLP